MFNRLTVLVPGCCGPLPAQYANAVGTDPTLSKLSLWTFLARADQTPAMNSFEQQLVAGFNPQITPDVSAMASPVASPIPWAALDRLAESGEQDDKLWLHADPVCMQADMDHAILFDAHSLQLRDDEADQLIAELNAHFAQDGILIHNYSAASWYISIDTQANFKTHALYDVIGRNVNHFMPTGEDASVWKRFMNEAQMLLHMSDVNQQREARGHLPVNSIWLWGEGRLSGYVRDSSQSAFDVVMSNNHSVLGMAKLHSLEHSSLPETFSDAVLETGKTGHALLVLDALLSSLHYEDIAEWQQQLCRLDQQWLQPLLKYCLQHKIMLDLYPCNSVRYHMQSRQRYRFWRRARINEHLRLHGQN